jgi:hypothetical protein
MGTLTPELLAGIDYVPVLTGCGSVLEQIFVTLCNVMRLDETGEVTNASLARRRAAEHVRCLIDPDYNPEPPFTEEETALSLA